MRCRFIAVSQETNPDVWGAIGHSSSIPWSYVVQAVDPFAKAARTCAGVQRLASGSRTAQGQQQIRRDPAGQAAVSDVKGGEVLQVDEVDDGAAPDAGSAMTVKKTVAAGAKEKAAPTVTRHCDGEGVTYHVHGWMSLQSHDYERLAGLIHERDPVQGGVELPVAGAAQAVSGFVRRPDRQWRRAGAAREGVLGSEPVDACRLADDLGRSDRTAPRDRDERRREIRDRRCDLGGQVVDLNGELAATVDQAASESGYGSAEVLDAGGDLVENAESVQRAAPRFP